VDWKWKYAFNKLRAIALLLSALLSMRIFREATGCSESDSKSMEDTQCMFFVLVLFMRVREFFLKKYVTFFENFNLTTF
jgi:hypothetical protein